MWCDIVISTQDPPVLSDCRFEGLPEDAVELKSLTISPDPPKPGDDLTVSIDAYVKEQIVVLSISVRLPLR